VNLCLWPKGVNGECDYLADISFSRLEGLDLARFLAFVGMVVVNLAYFLAVP